MNRTLLLLPLTALVLTSCQEKNTFAPPPPPQVTVQMPVIQDVTLYETFPGRVDNKDSVELTARVQGFLEKIHFEDGAMVKKGDLLFSIEKENYEAAVNAAKASVAQAEAGLSLAKAALSRKQRAFETQAVSELDVLTAEAEVQQAEAALQTANANLEQAELNLSYTEIYAPMDGVIDRSTVSEGNLVGSMGSSDLAMLVRTDPMQVYFSMDERRLLPKLRQIADSKMTLEEMPDVSLALADGELYEHTGRIDFADNVVNANTGTLDVRAEFPNPQSILIGGMFARVRLPIPVEQAMLIPEISIQRDLSGPFVYILDDTGTVQSAYVKLGSQVEEERVILEGLQKNDRVVVKGIQRVRPGVKANTAAPGSQPGAAGQAAGGM